ncbi:alpha/beta fold hydrolase [Tahibacter amnicola]|uniref:Alpha/beta fold hydrolase n=1 Tax=Tahibacter amnicola TaxID=2976241 RepID=A0ABY6BJR0_9GAMM|nr:alpha/beta fold hydrolase [Tahibacter amnicola]UXI70251.1 alpha/beta fold hydrolase [Tahibacter amnicola]
MSPDFVPDDQFLTLGGNRIRYWSAGEQGTSVVLVHALGASIEYWGRVIGPLATHHRVFALDLLGFGQSDKPEVAYAEPLLAGVVREFVDALRLQRFALVGNSMGGAVAQRVTRDIRDRVSRLILVCAGGLGYGISRRVCALSLPLLGEWVSRPRKAFVDRLVKGCVAQQDAVAPSLLDAALRYFQSPGAHQAFLRTLRNGIGFRGQRAAIVDAHRAAFPALPPTLVMWGDCDPLIPFDYADAIGNIPHRQVHRFADCGHYPQLEHPGEFCRVTLNFLREQQDAALDGYQPLTAAR